MTTLILILILTLCPLSSWADLQEESIVVGADYTQNDKDNDNHMYYDGTYLWIVNTEYQCSGTLCASSTFEENGQNLLKYNPTTRTYTEYTLTAVGGGNHLLYAIAPNPASTFLYVFSPYSFSADHAVWQIDIADGSEDDSLELTDMINGGGGKIVVTNDGTNDIVWTTNGTPLKLSKSTFDGTAALNTIFTATGSEGTYGLAATRTSTTDIWNIYMCTWGGVLYIIDSAVDNLAEDSVTVNFRTETTYTDFTLFDAYYDGENVWLSASATPTGGSEVMALVKYKPAVARKTLGTYEIFYTTITGLAPVDVKSRGRYVYMSGEKFAASTSSRTLAKFDKVTETFTYITLTSFGTYQREMTGLEILNNGEVWIGGYGYNSVDGSDTWRLTRVHEPAAWMR